MAERSYLSIGQVLDLLKREFPDLTISKIRFLESQGLLDPERTPSGYRKFYEPDVERLRFILRAQQDQYLPLKVIRGRLGGETTDDDGLHGGAVVADAEPATVGAVPRAAGGAAAAAGSGSGGVASGGVGSGSGGAGSGVASGRSGSAASGSSVSGSAGSEPSPPGGRTPGATDRPATSGSGSRGQTAHPSGPRNGVDPGPDEGAGSSDGGGTPGAGAGSSSTGGGAGSAGSGGAGGRTRAGGDASARGVDSSARGGLGGLSPRLELVPTAENGVAPDPVSVTLEELAAASGLSVAEVTELERFGLLNGRRVAGAVYYDGDCLEIALLAATFRGFGVEARHLRMYRTAVEREAGFFEQVVTPMLKQRNPQARVQAVETLLELSRLGQRMRAAVLRQALRDYTGGP